MSELDDGTPNPTASRWELGARLRELRKEAGLTVEDVAQRLMISVTKVVRWENGQRPATRRDLKDVADLYGIDEVTVGELQDLVVDSRAKPWYAEFTEFSPALRSLFDLELAADSTMIFEPILVPGLLQTPGYTVGMLEGARPVSMLTEEQRTRIMRARGLRQDAILGSKKLLDMRIIMDEAVLWRAVGGDAVMRNQLRHIVELSKRPSITVQVLPFNTGAHPGVDGGFQLFQFDGTIEDAVYLESLHADWFLRREAFTEVYVKAFASLAESALDPGRSRLLIAQHAERASPSTSNYGA